MSVRPFWKLFGLGCAVSLVLAAPAGCGRAGLEADLVGPGRDGGDDGGGEDTSGGDAPGADGRPGDGPGRDRGGSDGTAGDGGSGDGPGADGPGGDLPVGSDGGPRPDGAGFDLGPDLPPGAVPVGESCATDGDCGTGGFCATETDSGFPGGYCISACDFAQPGSCGGGADCLTFGQGGDFCVATCGGDGDCRPGYVCIDDWFGGVTTSGGTFCVPGNRDADLGDACDAQDGCAPGDFCITPDQGTPGGYCSRGCVPGQAGDCGAGAECIDVGQGQGFCVLGCTGPTCRQGYACVQDFLGFDTQGTVCAPGQATAVPVGSPCVDTGDCTAGSQFCFGDDFGFTGGYCTQACNPQQAQSCGAGNVCLNFDPQAPDTGFCFAGCSAAADCNGVRTGGTGTYGCSDRVFGVANPGGARICIPFDPQATIGSPCVGIGDCTLGAFCIADDQGQAGQGRWVNGYCSDGCTAGGLPGPVGGNSCGTGNVCFAPDPQAPDQGFCLDGCGARDACRTAEDFSCQPLGPGARRACLPNN